ncbi:hypothetical protein [Mycolicibacterium peregrinum]|uniref:hypothetical protein n=1 Tax=Mycolicibacterium peregrinum TaxID=43304 RepID=UPI003AB079C6
MTAPATAPRVAAQASFAQRYLQGTHALIEALTVPSQEAFDRAHRDAIRAIGAAFITGGADDRAAAMQWDLGQSLAVNVVDAAQRFGFRTPR